MFTRNRSIIFLPLFFLLSGWAGGTQLTNFSRSFEVSGQPRLVAELGMGDILISPGPGRTVGVEVAGIDQQDLSRLEVRAEGNTVFVTFRPEQRRSQRSPKFEFTVPADTDLELTTAGGDVQAGGTLQGSVKVKTAGGDIVLMDVDGPVHARTAGGDIRAGTVRSDCEFTTAGGDIDLAAADGNVTAKTSGGDITVGDVGQNLEAATSGGNIRIGRVSGSATARTAGGDVSVDAVEGKAELKTSGGDIVLSSARGEVSAATAGGDLRLQQLEGPITASTAGGDIAAQILNASSGSSFATAGGDIELQLAPSARVTVRATVQVRGNWSREGRDFGIESDFGPVQLQRDQAANELRADIPVNGGGVEIRCDTSNGWIRIKGLR
jgi:DUF4097 and DUF4098 domain-containing protein YvlB